MITASCIACQHATQCLPVQGAAQPHGAPAPRATAHRAAHGVPQSAKLADQLFAGGLVLLRADGIPHVRALQFLRGLQDGVKVCWGKGCRDRRLR